MNKLRANQINQSTIRITNQQSGRPINNAKHQQRQDSQVNLVNTGVLWWRSTAVDLRWLARLSSVWTQSQEHFAC